MVEESEAHATTGDFNVQCPEISSSSSFHGRICLQDRITCPIFSQRPNCHEVSSELLNIRRLFRPSARPPIHGNEFAVFQPSPSSTLGPMYRAPAQVEQEAKKWALSESAKAVIVLLAVFGLSAIILAAVYYTFPDLEEKEKQYFRLPRSYDDALNLGRVLERYKEKYYFQVFSAMVFVYIFLQTFAIPGSIFLSVLSGFLYPFVIALGLVCFCSATGASFCYLLSQCLGRKLVYKYFPNRANKYALLVRHHKDDLLSYIIFLRITPFLPNWFINIAAPVVDVPLIPFYIGTFLGVAPPSFVAIQGGKSLHELTKSGDTMSLTSVILLAVFATISLIPVFLRTRLRSKFD